MKLSIAFSSLCLLGVCAQQNVMAAEHMADAIIIDKKEANLRRKLLATCPGKYASVNPPSESDLDEWDVADYDGTNGFLSEPNSGTVAERGYIYDSVLTETGELFRDDYKPTNTLTAYPRDGSSPGVPGAYPYDEGYESWGGDEVLLGKTRYTAMIAHFGHSHIMTVGAKVNILKRDPCAETVSQDMFLEHLLDGSKQIFAWFAGLVDSDGNPTPIPNHPIVQQLAGIMQMPIYGDGTVDGVIDIQSLSQTLTGFVDMAMGLNHPNKETLAAEKERVEAYLQDVLNLDGGNPIPLKAWLQLMDVHQGHTVSNFIRFQEVYHTRPTDPGYAALVEQANEEHIQMINTGPQMAAFFGLFYSFTNFLDKFYYTAVDDEYAIPFSIMDDNVPYTQRVLKERWMEHTVMFSDFNKAAALDDEEAMFKTQLNMLDSCTALAPSIAEVFYRFDRLMRGRNVFAYLMTIEAV